MCLLERIVAADAHSIVCATMTHRAQSNPLRLAGRLSALHLAEYGAQAMAAHGGMLRVTGPADAACPTPGKTGLLVSIRDLELLVNRLDDQQGELLVTARSLLLQANGSIYSFEACVDARLLGRGRVQVLFARDQ